jgi:hypothetical protein
MILLLQSLSVRCKTRGTNFVSGRSTYPKNWLMFSVCQNTEKDTGSEPKAPGVSKIKEQERPTFFLCTRNFREAPFCLFFFLLHLLLFFLYYNFPIFFSYLNVSSLPIPFPILSSPFLYFVVQTSNPVSTSHIYIYTIFFEILHLLRCHFGSYCTILFRIISSVIVFKCFIGFCPRPFISCTLYLQFLTPYLHS